MNSLELWYYEWLLRRRLGASATDEAIEGVGLIW
jgi:hypothetical protein